MANKLRQEQSAGHGVKVCSTSHLKETACLSVPLSGANRAVGGFEEIIDASSFDFPNSTLTGLKTGWCEQHRSTLQPKTYAKRGRALTAKELAE
jgi:hypothetical protein